MPALEPNREPQPRKPYNFRAGAIAKGEADALLPAVIPVRVRARPKGFSAWQVVKRLEWTFGCSLDDIEEVVNWDPNSLDPIRFRAWKEMVLGMLHVGAKFGLQRQRTDDSLALMEVRKRLDRHDADTTSSVSTEETAAQPKRNRQK